MIADVRLGGTQAVKMYRGDDVVWERQSGELPAGYKRCRYLESAGYQYIDTLRGIDIAASYTISGMCTSNENSEIFGAEDESYWNGLFIRREIAGNVASYRNYYGAFMGTKNYINALLINDASYNVNKWFNFKIYRTADNKKQVLDADGRIVTKTSVPPNVPYNVHLFGVNRWNGNRGKTYLKIGQYTTASKDDTPIESYIPCIDAHGRPCMFDIVSNRPFYNAGTGEFGYELEDGAYVAPV